MFFLIEGIDFEEFEQELDLEEREAETESEFSELTTHTYTWRLEADVLTLSDGNVERIFRKR